MPKSQQFNRSKLFYRATLAQRLTAGAIFVLVAGLFAFLWLIGSGRFDFGRWYGVCGMQQRYHLPCPTCGMTTSGVAFVAGRLLEAFYIQPAGALLCCLLALTAFLALLTAVSGVYLSFVKRFFTEVKLRYVILVLAIVITAAWAVTLARALAER